MTGVATRPRARHPRRRRGRVGSDRGL